LKEFDFLVLEFGEPDIGNYCIIPVSDYILHNSKNGEIKKFLSVPFIGSTKTDWMLSSKYMNNFEQFKIPKVSELKEDED
jgi:hypothetical protein